MRGLHEDVAQHRGYVTRKRPRQNVGIAGHPNGMVGQQFDADTSSLPCQVGVDSVVDWDACQDLHPIRVGRTDVHAGILPRTRPYV